MAETEYSKKYVEDMDEKEDAEGTEVEEVVAALREDLNFIYDNPENGQLLDNNIIQAVETNYETGNRKDWDKALEEMKTELLATEDEDEIRQILQNYSRKIRTELI